MRGPTFQKFDSSKKCVSLEGLDKCAADIKLALFTRVGTRPNLPEFGSKLHTLNFDLLNNTMIDLAFLYIQECLQVSVPDVILDDIQAIVDKPGRKVNFTIKFRDSASGKQGNIDIEFKDGIYNG